MRLKTFFFCLILFIALAGCGGGPENSPNVDGSGDAVNEEPHAPVAQDSATWDRFFPSDHILASIMQTSDNGFIGVGSAPSSIQDSTRDLWVVKLAPGGSIAWQKAYNSGHSYQYASSIDGTSDGGYVVAGTTIISSSHYGGSYMAWVLRLGPDGAVVWERYFHGDSASMALGGSWGNSIRQTSDGGFILAGEAFLWGEWLYSQNGMMVKLDPAGNVLWEKFYDSGPINTVEETVDGGYIASGYSNWLLRLASDGEVVWRKEFSDSTVDINSVENTFDNGFIISATLPTSPSGYDAFIVKLAQDGSLEWQKAYGGSGSDASYSVRQTSDGGYIAVGKTYSSSSYDALVLKLAPDGGIEWQKKYGAGGNDYLWSVQETAGGGFIASGVLDESSTNSGWVLRLDSNGEISSCATGSSADLAASDPALGLTDGSAAALADSRGGASPTATVYGTAAEYSSMCLSQ